MLGQERPIIHRSERERRRGLIGLLGAYQDDDYIKKIFFFSDESTRKRVLIRVGDPKDPLRSKLCFPICNRTFVEFDGKGNIVEKREEYLVFEGVAALQTVELRLIKCWWREGERLIGLEDRGVGVGLTIHSSIFEAGGILGPERALEAVDLRERIENVIIEEMKAVRRNW